MYEFVLPIGDWSEVGHCERENYTIRSNFDIAYVRVKYLDTKQRTGSSLDGEGAPFYNTEENKLYLSDFKKLGLDMDAYLDWFTFTDSKGVFAYPEPHQIADVFCDYMMTHNPELKLEIVPNSTVYFQFTGYDVKGRHIGNIGYGLLSN